MVARLKAENEVAEVESISGISTRQQIEKGGISNGVRKGTFLMRLDSHYLNASERLLLEARPQLIVRWPSS